jgi:hypothetical protein
MSNGNVETPTEAEAELSAESHRGVRMEILDTSEEHMHDERSFVEAKRKWAAINQRSK